MKKKIEFYRFEKISRDMARKFGTIEKYLEGQYEKILFPLESNLLKANRKHGIDNGRRAIEAIHICLLIVDSYLNKIEYDLDPYISDANKPYLTALLMGFDPFTNEYLIPVAEEKCDIHSEEGLRGYFEAPVKCLLRIEKSIEFWTKESGVVGYFDFLEKRIGNIVAHDDKINGIVVKVTESDTDDQPKITMRDICPDMSLQEMFLDLFPAIAVIFKLGFIPSPDEIQEITKEEYDAYQQQGGDISERLFTIVPKNYKYMGPSNEINLLTDEETIKIGKAALFLELYASENGCASQESEDILKFAAKLLPTHFTKGTEFERAALTLLKPGEMPLTAQEEVVDLLAHVMGEGATVSIKATYKDENESIERVEKRSMKSLIPRWISSFPKWIINAIYKMAIDRK